MSNELMNVLIDRMHVKLNEIIVKNDFNLQNDDVQKYSRRLDRALYHYLKHTEKKVSTK